MRCDAALAGEFAHRGTADAAMGHSTHEGESFLCQTHSFVNYRLLTLSASLASAVRVMEAAFPMPSIVSVCVTRSFRASLPRFVKVCSSSVGRCLSNYIPR